MADTEHPELAQDDVATNRSGVVRPLVRWGARLVALLATLVIALLVLIDSPIGHRFIIDQIARQEPQSGLRIQIGRIDGSVYSQATLHDLVLSDPKGEFLRVPEVELDWRPLRWLHNTLDIRDLTLRRGQLLRVPELAPGDPDSPILPTFDIRLDRLSVEDFTLSEAILGEERVVGLTASALIRKGRVKLDGRGELGDLDRFAVLVDAEPDGDVFDLELDYNAPKDGVLARLTGAESDLRARITGDGSWARWDGAALVEEGGQRLAAFRVTNRSGTYGVLGQAYPGRHLAGLAGRAAGSALNVSARGTLEDNRLDGRFALSGTGAVATGQGALDLGESVFDDLALDLTVRDPALLGGGTQVEGARLAATLSGPFSAPLVDHRVQIARLVSGETQVLGLSQSGLARPAENGWTIPLALTADRVITGLELADARLANGRLDGALTLAGNALSADGLQLEFPGVQARITTRIDLASGAIDLSGPAQLSGLVLEDLGVLDGNANFTFRTGPQAPWSLAADVRGVATRVDNRTVESIAGTGIRFAGGVLARANEPLLFNGVSLNGSKLELALDGRLVDGETLLVGTGQHSDYGPFQFDARMDGEGPRAALVLESPLPAAGLRDVHLAIAPITDGFGIDTQGQSLLGAFDGQADLRISDANGTRLDIRRLTVSRTNATGQLGFADGFVLGQLHLSGGGVDGSVNLRRAAEGQGIDLALKAANARFGGEVPLTLGAATIDAKAVLVEGNSTINATASARGIGYGKAFIGRLAGKAAITNGTGDLAVAVSGRRGSSFNLQFDGTVAPERLSLIAKGDFEGRPITTPRRIVLTKEPEGVWALEKSQLSYGKGYLIAEGRFGGEERFNTLLKFDHMPLSLLDIAVENAGLSGTVSGVVDYQGRNGGPPKGSARLLFDGLSRSGLTLTSRPIDLAVVLDLSASEFQARAVVDEGGNRIGRLQARIANLPEAGRLVRRLNAGRLNSQVSFEGPADAFWRLSAVEAFDVSGTLKASASATGTLANPRVTGAIGGDGLRVRSALTGTDVRNVSVSGTFSGSRLRLTRFAGTAINGGKVSGSGIVDLAGLDVKGPTLDLRIAATGARILDRSDMAATVTGPLRLVSDGVRGVIAGRLKIESADWSLGTASTAEMLPKIRTREINLPLDIAPVRTRRQTWSYMIDAKADNRVNVRGMGIESEWGADIRIRGTTEDPRIGGRAAVIRGTYSFAGTNFNLTRGQIAFDEDVPPDPRLDILAESDVNDLTVTVAVRGNALSPEITFTSNPSLPEEEVMARLLFGGSINNLSATDALQLGAAIASLRGGGGMDPINRLRSAIGLDRLRILAPDPSIDRGTAVALGKNFGGRFYAEIITDGAAYNATALEFRITSWLSLLASVSSIGRENAFLEYSRDY